MLSDRDIRRRLDEDELVIEPIEDLDTQLQPVSVDVRLGHTFVVYQLPHVSYIDTRDDNTSAEYTRTVERVEGRSSIGRLAVVVHATAGFLDPGFEGNITLELSNLGRVGVKLCPGMWISQLVFQEMTSAAERSYGPERESKYIRQEGPVTSRIDEDEN